MAAEPFNIPKLKKQVGWRLNERDAQNLRVLMADRRETNVTKILRDLVEQEAEPVRERMQRSAALIAAKEESNG